MAAPFGSNTGVTIEPSKVIHEGAAAAQIHNNQSRMVVLPDILGNNRHHALVPMLCKR
jgi:hypothetical protein